jgi:hypothetical protein
VGLKAVPRGGVKKLDEYIRLLKIFHKGRFFTREYIQSMAWQDKQQDMKDECPWDHRILLKQATTS